VHQDADGGLPATPLPAPVSRDEDRAARVALTWLAEPGNRAVWAMERTAGAPATLDRLMRGDIPDGALRSSVLARTAVGDPRRLAEGALRRAERVGARLVVPDDPEWPVTVEALARMELDIGGRVNQDTRPPLCIWVRGDRPLRDTLDRSVAVVGARAATAYGVHVTTGTWQQPHTSPSRFRTSVRHAEIRRVRPPRGTASGRERHSDGDIPPIPQHRQFVQGWVTPRLESLHLDGRLRCHRAIVQPSDDELPFRDPRR
jgi:hypothetical protein